MKKFFLIRSILCLFPALVVAALSAHADPFDDAARQYERGQAADAASAYEDFLNTKGPSYALLYNLGNAHYRAGAVGKAIWSWREAAQLNPWDSDARTNLATAIARYNLPQATGFGEVVLRRLRLGTSAWASLVFTATATALFGFSLWNPGLYHRTTAFRWFASIAAAGAWLAYSGALWYKFTGPNAIVIAHEGVVRHGPLEESPAAYPVPDGSELRILGTRREWYHVADSNGREGWIAQTQLKRLMP